MTAVGAEVREIRTHTGTERVFYVARFAKGVDVLHVFEERARKASKRDVALAR